jgi:DNA (cytosine-5)-methyltransferase 1
MNFISVCSGIEAASVAWSPLGWKPLWFSEIEPFPSAVLAHHYPNTPNLGDMTKFQEWPNAAVDLLCGGTPCQSFSVAGLRKGLDDPRGNLMLTFGAIAAKYRPQWLVWENVPGVLSSNGGADFGSFLGMLGELGYGFAYRVLDAQYFGVAQRRRRVFVVACLGDWRSAAAVLFERHSMSGNPAPSREARQVAPTIPSRSTAGGGLGTDFDCDGGTICVATGQAGAEIGADMAPTLNCNHEAPYVAHSLRGEGFDASEDGTPLVVDVCPTLRAGGNKTGGDRPPGTDVDTADSLIPVLAFDTTQVTSAANRSNPKPGDPCHPLAAGAHAPAIAFDCKASGQSGFGVGEIASTMRAMGHADSHQNGGGHQAVAYSIQAGALRTNPNSGPDGIGVQADHAYTLEARAEVQAVQSAMQVRRLTPEECEALQGFPRGYSAIPWRKKAAADCPDGPRYKALGNSWAVPNVRWIGERLQQVEAIRKEQRAAA